MSLAKEIMGTSLIDRSSLLGCELGRRNQFSTRVVGVRKKVVRIAVAAVSEDLVKSSSASASASAAVVIPMSGDGVKFKVRVVVTVRQKKKEDFKERIAKQLDAMADMIGQNVVLQLVSMEIDPSEEILGFFPD